MAFVDHNYFGSVLPLIVADNEPAIDAACGNYEPDYLRAALGTTLADTLTTALADPKGVYFSNQYSNQFDKGGLDIRWNWIVDGKTFQSCGRSYRWPGLRNAQKRSPLANYIYWKYLAQNNPRPTSVGGFADTDLENAQVSSVRQPMIRAWNEMVDWHCILYKLLTSADPATGLWYYPEFVPAELCEPESVNVYNYQINA